MPTASRAQPCHDIMTMLTPTLFLIAALSGSYLFSIKATRRSKTRTRDISGSHQSKEPVWDSEDDDLDTIAQSRQLIYDSGDGDDEAFLLVLPSFRTQFGVRSGAAVRGYPSRGGIYVLHCNPVELDFLQLDRFHIAMRAMDQKEEDRHCFNMRKLGATWWESEEAYARRAMEWYDRTKEPVTYVGWPSSGGVWVLRTTQGDASERGVGRINNAFNMEERWRIIRDMGGIFYENPRDGLDLDV
ncbi:hypothetical protein F4821DRAFT_248215 [Hypoxylon rubiginosum]|uniref:Uncharacterized protein n=1 Tax=Hypoxylon rubiginosum TaxID=110542 RepID=A0ACC0CNR0_9PEZI|nr:hypothetical protein F4821DRAFT_248215 [Hypoxylon rubiginosum]